jgi:hypothetical protein
MSLEPRPVEDSPVNEISSWPTATGSFVWEAEVGDLAGILFYFEGVDGLPRSREAVGSAISSRVLVG